MNQNHVIYLRSSSTICSDFVVVVVVVVVVVMSSDFAVSTDTLYLVDIANSHQCILRTSRG